MRQQQLRHLLALSFGSGLIVLASAASAAAQTVVVGTGDPDIDVPAVQAAVDQGGRVILQGHFSFDRAPTVVPVLDGYPLGMILVSTAVVISGQQGNDGEMTTIEAGQNIFEVEAQGFSVTIEGLRFIRPKRDAINVFAASGLVIASCRIEGVEPVLGNAAGIAIHTLVGLPTPTNPGHPDWLSGTLLVVNNDIDVAGGTANDNTLGVAVISVGVPGAEVDVHISGNRVRNTTERAIDVIQVGGRADISRNVMTTSTIVGAAYTPAFRDCGPGSGTDVIHVADTGSYLVAHNSVRSRWATGGGIRVHGQFAQWPITGAVVVDNDINMEAPEGAAFCSNSAGIYVQDFAQDNLVLNNRIRGHARAALDVAFNSPADNANNAFILNRLDGFSAALTEIIVGEGVMDTLIVGQGTVEDHGIGTMIVRVP